jgi:hypothetical protein
MCDTVHARLCRREFNRRAARWTALSTWFDDRSVDNSPASARLKAFEKLGEP